MGQSEFGRKRVSSTPTSKQFSSSSASLVEGAHDGLVIAQKNAGLSRPCAQNLIFFAHRANLAYNSSSDFWACEYHLSALSTSSHRTFGTQPRIVVKFVLVVCL
jgi:hypothetical protein